jgi:N-acetylmuramoyl-L-alanine amidase
MLALDTARRVARILRARGFRVIETRTSDYFVTLGRRVEIANRTPGAIFVSIHYNYARRVAARGLEVFYYSPRSRRLAANILREMLRSYPTENRGVKRGRYYVLRNNRRPAVLCELGFLTNPADNRYVQSSWYRQRLAERIAAGIVAESRGRSPR